MKLHNLLKAELVKIDCKETVTENVLKEIVDDLKAKKIISDKEPILDKLMEREKLGTTSIGHHAAVPHTKVKDLKNPVIAIGVSKNGFQYHESDKEPVHLVILILSPSYSPVVHLQILAAAASLVKKSGRLIKQILAADTPQALIDVIRKFETEEEND